MSGSPPPPAVSGTPAGPSGAHGDFSGRVDIGGDPLDLSGRSLYLNLPLQHRFFDRTGQMRFTPPVQVVYALEQALAEYEAEGGAARAARYRECFEALDGGVRGLGFRRLLPEQQLSRILTAYVEPDHPAYSFDAMHDHLYAQGYTIYPGKGAREATFRLANMGAVNKGDMLGFVGALEQTLERLQIRPLYRCQDARS